MSIYVLNSEPENSAAADLWQVEMTSDATGTEATPFSATVS